LRDRGGLLLTRTRNDQNGKCQWNKCDVLHF
jgi:hypothetical protein